MDTACRAVKSWQEKGANGLRLCINVSSRQFREGRILTMVNKALDLSGLAPGCLELEFTEGLLMEDEVRVRNMLAELSANGVRLCIDDFGTGYSPLNFLKRLLFTSVKIDRAFLSEITHNPDDARITQAVIDMAHRLGLKVVGEGVETEAQSEFLRNVKCDLVQGNLFCPPMHLEEAREFFATRVAASARLAAKD